MQQVQYDIGGMSCSFCAETINKALGSKEGVEQVEVSLAHEEVMIQFNEDKIKEVELKDTLRDLGYTIRDPDKQKRYEEQQEELQQGKKRLVQSGTASILTAGLMGYMIFIKGVFESQSLLMDYTVLGLALLTMFGPGFYIKDKAYNSLKRGIFNQHVLLEAGAFAALTGGLLGLFVFPSFPTVHFLAVSVFLTAYHILSEYTSLIVRTRASRAVNDLMDLQPDTARKVSNGEVEEVEVDELEVGDKVRVKPGENVPIDGKVLEGQSAVDESVATGESAPVDKQKGDEVIGGSVNQTGTLLIEVTATGEDAFLNQVAHQIEEARAMKPGVVQLADKILKYFVPGVLTVAAISFIFWISAPILWGAEPNIQRGLFAALTALVLGYPCALGMATPLALVRGGGEAANRGILMRSGDAFQIFHEVENIVLDKTGTITEGEPSVEEVISLTESEDEVVGYAASAESFSEHPLAEAVIRHAEERQIDFPEPENFDSVTGKGVKAEVDGEEVLVGKPDWLKEETVLEDTKEELQNLQDQGLTAIGIVVENELIGLIGIGDKVKEDAADTIQRMKDKDITPVMITGDNERTAEAVASEVGIEKVMAEVLPDDKRDEIGQFQEEGRVAMVGDGINDAPALTQADIGIAIGAGTDIAIESADIVLMRDELGGVMDAYEIGKTSYKKTRQNLIAAFSFNGIGVAAAVTGLVHPVFAMIAMIGSVSAVLANSFMGQLISGEGINTDFEPGNDDQDQATDKVCKKNSIEKYKFDVNLHCEGCEQRVENELSEKEGVKNVDADHREEIVEVELIEGLTNKEEIQKSISDMDYKVKEVK